MAEIETSVKAPGKTPSRGVDEIPRQNSTIKSFITLSANLFYHSCSASSRSGPGNRGTL